MLKGVLLLFLAIPSWAGYSYSRAVTVAHAQVSGGSDLTQFPIIICGNASSGVCNASISGLNQTGGGAHVQNSNGYDIIFTSDSGCTTPLTWEMEKYVASTGEFEAWVTNTTTPLSHSADTTFYMCYGNAAISTFQSTASAVWDSHFVGVYHLPNGSTVSPADSTASNAGTLVNTMTGIQGQIDGAAGITTINNGYITTANIANIATPTAEAWVYISIIEGQNSCITGVVQGNGSGTDDKSLFINSTNNIAWYIYDGTSKTVTSGSAISENAWHYVVGSADGTNARVYIDGSVAGGPTAAGNTYTSYTGPGIEISGTRGGNPNCVYPNANIDEVRWSNVARSAGWIATTYNSISAPSSFYTMGAETSSSSSYAPQSQGLVIQGGKVRISGGETRIY